MLEKKILYVSQQIFPFILENNALADTCKSLPLSVAESGHQVRIFTPRYGLVNERRNQLHEVIRLSGMNLIISNNDHQLIIKVASVPNSRQQVYFVDNEDFFKRKAVARDPETGTFFADNDQRAMFFARGVLETVKKLRWAPDCIHLHGWMCSFVPAYLKYYFKDDPIFNNTKIILSLYDTDPFTEMMDSELYNKLKSDKMAKGAEADILKEPSYENLVKYVMQYCAGVILVGNVSDELSKYVEESETPFMRTDAPTEDSIIDTEKYIQFYEKILEK